MITTLLLTVAAQVAWSSSVLVPLTPRDSDSAAESAHPRVETAVVEWSRSCAQSCVCHQTRAPPAVSLQQHGGRSPQSLWLWVQPLRVLPWKWPLQGQGESVQPLCENSCFKWTQMHGENVNLVFFLWQVSKTEELLHLLKISPKSALYRTLVIKLTT